MKPKSARTPRQTEPSRTLHRIRARAATSLLAAPLAIIALLLLAATRTTDAAPRANARTRTQTQNQPNPKNADAKPQPPNPAASKKSAPPTPSEKPARTPNPPAPATATDSQPQPKFLLRPASQLGAAARVTRTLKAEGAILPEAPADEPKPEQPPKPLKLVVEAVVEYDERVAAEEQDGLPARALRRVRKAAAAISGDVRPSVTRLRPEVATLVAERRETEVFLYSPDGPLARAELDIVRGPGDLLGWTDLFPAEPVAVGESWDVGDNVAREVSDYDALASRNLRAVLESCDDARAVIRFRGTVHGVARGGEGKMSVSAAVVFDRPNNRVVRVVVNRNENRAAGPIETALDMKSSLAIDIAPIDTPADLPDSLLAAIPNRPEPALERLKYDSPGGKFALEHDRDWHLFWDDARLAVFKRLDLGEVVAQVNLNLGPSVQPGSHIDLQEFERDIRAALGARFVKFLERETLRDDPRLGFLHRVSVEGAVLLETDPEPENPAETNETAKTEKPETKREDPEKAESPKADAPPPERRFERVGILWNYYVAASPAGDQVLATFTVAQANAELLKGRDVEFMNALVWKTPAPPKPASSASADRP